MKSNLKNYAVISLLNQNLKDLKDFAENIHSNKIDLKQNSQPYYKLITGLNEK